MNTSKNSLDIAACMDTMSRNAEIFSGLGTKGGAGANLLMVMANSVLITRYHKMVCDEVESSTRYAAQDGETATVEVELKEAESCFQTLSQTAQWFSDLKTDEGLKNAAALQAAKAVVEGQIHHLRTGNMSPIEALAAVANDELAFSKKVMQIVKVAGSSA